MIIHHPCKLVISTLFFCVSSVMTFAQKVQNVQETTVWAISPVKVDGKTIVVDFMALNKTTQLNYTLSNDDKNLYLVIKSTDNINNNKIMMGGITLSVNPNGKKKEKEGVSITYPVIARQQRGQGGGQSFVGGAQGQGAQGGQRLQGASADSAALARRKQQLAAVKEIKVFGIKDVTDSLISIYNEYEILAAANFDEKGAFVYELAVPLKSLGLTANSKEFAYNIKINGRQFGGGFGGGDRQGGGGFGGGAPNVIQVGGGRGGFDPSMFLPTDFWGKYSLAKK